MTRGGGPLLNWSGTDPSPASLWLRWIPSKGDDARWGWRERELSEPQESSGAGERAEKRSTWPLPPYSAPRGITLNREWCHSELHIQRKSREHVIDLHEVLEREICCCTSLPTPRFASQLRRQTYSLLMGSIRVFDE